MNQKQKTILFSLLGICIIMLLPILASAQLDAPPPENVDAPIDGGLSLLVAAGVGYGAKKLKAKRKVNIE